MGGLGPWRLWRLSRAGCQALPQPKKKRHRRRIWKHLPLTPLQRPHRSPKGPRNLMLNLLRPGMMKSLAISIAHLQRLYIPNVSPSRAIRTRHGADTVANLHILALLLHHSLPPFPEALNAEDMILSGQDPLGIPVHEGYSIIIPGMEVRAIAITQLYMELGLLLCATPHQCLEITNIIATGAGIETHISNTSTALAHTPPLAQHQLHPNPLLAL